MNNSQLSQILNPCSRLESGFVQEINGNVQMHLCAVILNVIIVNHD